jgi:hypothetical protein
VDCLRLLLCSANQEQVAQHSDAPSSVRLANFRPEGGGGGGAVAAALVMELFTACEVHTAPGGQACRPALLLPRGSPCAT